MLSSLALGALPRGAHAQQPAGAQQDAAPAGRDVAREFFRAGVDAYQRGSFNAALANFENAYRIAPHPNVRINIGNSLVQLRRTADALAQFEAYLTEAQNPPATQRAEIERQVQDLRGQLAELRVRVNPPFVRNAVFAVDGVTTALTNEPLRLAPGRHSLTLSAEGFVSEQASFDLRAGAQRDWVVDLRAVGSPEPAVTPPTPGPPVVNVGAPTPTTGQPQNPPPPPQAGGDVSQPPRRAERPWPLPVSLPTLVAAGATGVAFICWTGFGAGALGANASFNGAASNIATGMGTYATERQIGLAAAGRARGLAVAADVSLGLTVAGAATTVVLFFLTPPARRSLAGARDLTVVPLADAHSGAAGLAVGGAF